MPVLTAVDTVGIQQFVFASNRLRDVAGGSSIVRQATSQDGDSWLADSEYRSNVIVAAGGNIILKFPDMATARDFSLHYSRRMLDCAPGLEAVIEHIDYAPGEMAYALLRLLAQIQKSKEARVPSVPLLNLGVSEACLQTGLPATNYDDYGRPVSRAVSLRREASDSANVFWSDLLPRSELRAGRKSVRLEFPVDMDHLGRARGDISLVGIVHIDGNGMGRRVVEWVKLKAEAGISDEEFEKEYRELSKDIDSHVRKVVRRILERVDAALHWDDEDKLFKLRGVNGEIVLHEEKDKVYLPIRPVLTAGEDITFVCDGRIALDLAAFALEEFASEPVEHLGRMTACAGVSIVHSHTPIIRAYVLAEALCQSAKQLVRKRQQTIGCDADVSEETPDYGSALDWHVATEGIVEPLARLRLRQYQRDGNWLTLRPYFLGSAGSDDPSTWNWLVNQALRGSGFQVDLWRKHRSKAKRLMILAARGAEALKQELRAWQISSPGLTWPKGLPESGYIASSLHGRGKCTPLLDALELVDIYFALEETSHDDQGLLPNN